MDHEPSGWLLLFYILQRCVQRSRTSPQITIVDRPYLTEPAANSLKFHNHLNRLQKKEYIDRRPQFGRQWRQMDISAQHPDTPWEEKGDKAKSGVTETKQNHLSPASRHAMGDKGREGETKQSHLSPASRHTMGEKGRQGETQQSHLSPASRHAMGDKGRQSKVSHLSPAYRHAMGDKGRQSKSISAQHPDALRETKGDKGRQSKAQHPDRPWETRGDKARAGTILAQHR